MGNFVSWSVWKFSKFSYEASTLLTNPNVPMRAEKLGQAGQKRRHEKMARQCHANSALITKHVFTVFHHMTKTPFESKPLKVAIPRGANAVLIKKCCYTQSTLDSLGKGDFQKRCPVLGPGQKGSLYCKVGFGIGRWKSGAPVVTVIKMFFLGTQNSGMDGLVDMHVAQPFCSTSEFALFLCPSNAKNLRCPWQVWLSDPCSGLKCLRR